MSLHSKHTALHRGKSLDDEVYAGQEAVSALPAFRFPAKAHPGKAIEALVLDKLGLDGLMRVIG